MHYYETEHYIFRYENGSKAEQDIQYIADTQEASYKHITLMLGLSMKEKIHYSLVRQWDENASVDLGNILLTTAVLYQKTKCWLFIMTTFNA